ncbi:MAG: isoleucine--tRNA ligase [bacterium]|nr:isoleucine--tRNA ligase [bacterium]
MSNEKHYKKAEVRPNFPPMEEKWQRVWEEKKLFDVTNEIHEHDDPWVFFDGPPGTNGLPHVGHMMQSALKDVWPRFWTMRGRKVIRRAGWDTHGLPVELTAEKELGIQSKRGIEEYGVQKYIDYCRQTVFRYKSEWETAIRRIGREISLDDAYATYREPYILTNWWFLHRAWQTQINDTGDLQYSANPIPGYRRLLYRNYRILPYCCRCGTALANFEVSQGYKTVADLTLFAKFRTFDDPNTFFVAWTTTAWTLLSNVALCVGPEIEYAIIELKADSNAGKAGEKLIIAVERLEALKAYIPHYEIVGRKTGAELSGTKYHPLWDWQRSDKDHFVIADSYVTTEDGSGIVHLAAYGEDDYRLIRQYGLSLVQNVDENGFVVATIPEYGGRFFKAKNEKGDTLLDLDVLKDLHGRGLLLAKEKVEHEYPFCYRCDTPLMYYARAGWFLRMTDLKPRLLEGNASINWQPEHIRDGRFGNWLANVIDWNFTRERYWGSPLPIWTNRLPGDAEQLYCIGSLAELKRLAIDPIPENFDLHKPAIDEIRIKHPESGEILFREKFVLDSWFDAGMMPWGQWGYPNEPGSVERIDGFDRQYPCDFICEAIDQTRGWFYTLLACSVIYRTTVEAENTTLPEGDKKKVPPHSSYKNVICTELVVDDKGLKMSKSKGNVINPEKLFNKWGADPVRWQFYSSNPWAVKRFGDATIEEGLQQVLLPVWNAYVFFTTYAEADDWHTEQRTDQLTPMDRWILSRLRHLVETVTSALENFDVAHAADSFASYLDELNNWYIRRSRRRFWKSENDGDKNAAFTTLHTVLHTLSRMLAPFVPHLAEEIYSGIALTEPENNIRESVHLTKWMDASELPDRDEKLEQQQKKLREVVTMGHNLRQNQNLRVRQPLAELKVFHNADDSSELKVLEEEFGIIREELNVKTVTFVTTSSELVSFSAKPNLKLLGPRLGSKLKAFGEAVKALPTEELAKVRAGETITVAGEAITNADLLIECVAAEGWVARADGDWIVALDTRLTDELRGEGFTREIVNRIQNTRKDINLNVSDRITTKLSGSDYLKSLLDNPVTISYLKNETLSVQVEYVSASGSDASGHVGTPEMINEEWVGWEISRS